VALQTADGALPGWPIGRKELISADKYQTHQKDLVALRNAAALGCDFCGMVWARHFQFCHKHEECNFDHIQPFNCNCDELYLGTILLVINQSDNEKDENPLLYVMARRGGKRKCYKIGVF
jgi:hypothetical protein